jgi:hypothetical protein
MLLDPHTGNAPTDPTAEAHRHYPARAFIGSDKLLRGAHFEVQGVATRGAP